jgi:hypothetical protein
MRALARDAAIAERDHMLQQQLGPVEQQLRSPERLDAPPRGGGGEAGDDEGARRKLQAEANEDQQYLDALLENFLRDGADLRSA